MQKPEENEAVDRSDVVTRAMKLCENAMNVWGPIFDKAKDDLRFMSDEDGAQWPAEDYQIRIQARKPALQIDQLNQFINQVSNNVRMNTPSINVFPSDQSADPKVAEIYKGRIKDIEHQSRADDAYDNAVNFAIKCSLGFIRVDHDYKDNGSFDQDIQVKRVVNPFSVILDPTSVEADGSDAMWCVALDQLSKKEFESRYPGFDPATFDFGTPIGLEENCVTIAEFFEIEIVKGQIGLLLDGTIENVREGVVYKRTRDVEQRVVNRYCLSGKDILKQTTFPGKFIPLVPVYGEEAWENGKRKLNSLIRRAKDAQRMYNYWKTMEAELLIRAPKAVAIAPAGVTEDFAEDWLNPEKAAVLRYTPKQAPNGQFLPPPSLNPGPQIPAGLVNASQSAQMDIKSTMGLYNAFIGERSNETSGVAINARKVEGDRAVYHFGDNLVRSIAQVGRIIVSMIPVIDDTPKFVRVIGEDGSTKLVGINGALAEGQEKTHDLTKGEYSIRVTTGNNLPTMRQEAAALLQALIEKQPEMLTVVGDLLFKYQDFPGSEAIAERLKKLLQPGLADEEGEEKDPETVALQNENQQLKGALQQIQAELQSKQADLEVKQQEIALKAQEAQNSSEENRAKLELETAKLMLEKQKIEADIVIKTKELELKERELGLKEYQAANPAPVPEAQPAN